MSRIVVLGGGESGYGSAILAKVNGDDVFLSDKGAIAPKYLDKLRQWDIAFEQGQHTEALIMSADTVIKSPGIPDKAPMVVALRQAGVPVISEIEYAGAYTSAKSICITGSNGKTTTTTLIFEILKNAGYKVALAGNIGESYAYSVAMDVLRGQKGESPLVDWYVIELSSFQLDGMSRFKADISVLMNITPDHLDRYDYKMQNYVDSKMRITQNQSSSENFIYCADDKVVMSEIYKYIKGVRPLPFSSKSRGGAGACLHEGLMSACVGTESLTMSLSDLKIKGLHNAYNAMAASLAALSVGIDAEVIIATLKNFGGVEHRLEFVCESEGVEYINDSKATNVDSAWYALESMKRPVIWIAGGTDKGNDYERLKDFARDKVKVLVCMGVDNEKLKNFFGDVVPVIYDTKSMQEALVVSKAEAEAGDTVLLSPACASFDLFNNYEHRGELFKQTVKEITSK